MSFSNGELSAADVAAVTGANNGSFLGNNDGGYWLIILFLFIMMGGWGNNGGCGNGAANATVPAVQAGFDQAAVMGGIQGIQNGLASAEISRANTVNNITGQISGLASALQNCCCENRLGTADLKYTVANEACADRQAVNEGLRDILTNNTANTNAIIGALTQGFQSVQDTLCQQELDAYKRENDNLRTQINLQNQSALIQGQTAQILADNANQTYALEQYLNPTAKPAYIVQNPNCCQGNVSCGCGM